MLWEKQSFCYVIHWSITFLNLVAQQIVRQKDPNVVFFNKLLVEDKVSFKVAKRRAQLLALCVLYLPIDFHTSGTHTHTRTPDLLDAV